MMQAPSRPGLPWYKQAGLLRLLLVGYGALVFLLQFHSSLLDRHRFLAVIVYVGLLLGGYLGFKAAQYTHEKRGKPQVDLLVLSALASLIALGVVYAKFAVMPARVEFVHPFETVSFTGAAQPLSGALYLPKDYQAAVLLAHDLGSCSRSQAMATLADQFAQDFAVLTLDMPGQGRSGGKAGLADSLALVAAAQYLQQRCKSKPLVGVAFGLSCADLLSAYAQGAPFAALILVSPPYSTDRMKVYRERIQRPLSRFMLRILGVRTAKPFACPAPEEALEGLNHKLPPLLVIAGEEDRVFAPSEAEALLKAAPFPHKRLELLQGTHGEALFAAQPERFYSTCRKWLGEVLYLDLPARQNPKPVKAPTTPAKPSGK